MACERSRPRLFRLSTVSLFCFLSALCTTLAQQSTGTIIGRIMESGNHSTGMRIQLIEAVSHSRLQEALPDPAGNFAFYAVPFGVYSVQAFTDTILIGGRIVKVHSNVPVTVTIEALREFETEAVVVSAQREASMLSSGGSHTLFTAAAIDELIPLSNNNAIESILLNTSGVVPDEDGRLHVRGEDAQIQYVVDGIPVSGNMTRIYSSLFDAQVIKSADVQTGSFNPEYGVATAAVVDINTRSGLDQPLAGRGSVMYGSFNAREAAVQLGGSLGGRTGAFFAFDSFTSDRYLDPIASSRPNHSGGTAHHYFGKINSVLSGSTELSLLGMYNTTVFSIPNGTERTPSQNQVQNLEDYMIGARLSVAIDDRSLVSVLGYRRQARARITSSGMSRLYNQAEYAGAIVDNEKFFFGGDRLNTVTGGQVEWSLQSNWFEVPNSFKAGIGGEVYPLHEYFTFAITNPDLSNPNISGGDSRYIPYDLTKGGTPFLVDESRTGKRFSAYVQDQVQFGRWTINGGLRFDMFDLFEQESAVSPRLNAAYMLDENWIVRASYNRIVMQAPVENILVSSSGEARRLVGDEQGATPTTVQSERSHVIELGATHFFSRYLDLNISAFGKLIDNFLVKVELGNSGVIFPANLKNGVAAGGEVRLRLNDWNRLSGFLSVSSCVSLGLKPEDGSSPVAAGLLLGEEGRNYSHPFSREEAFPTEHNQLLTAVLNLNYHYKNGFFGGIEGRFDFGLPFDLTGPDGEGLNEAESRAELRRRGYSDEVIDLLALEEEEPGSPDKAVAPHAIFDLSAGYDFAVVFAVPLRLSASVHNVFDTPFLYKFESSFGGTHFGYPRMVNVKLESRI
jgi:outer membrane cobalamin receptor